MLAKQLTIWILDCSKQSLLYTLSDNSEKGSDKNKIKNYSVPNPSKSGL